MFRGTIFLVHQKNHKIQITGKINPQQIGNLQVCGSSVNPAELKDHFDDGAPEDDKPYESKQERKHIKEDNGPKKVQDQLECITEQGI